MPSGSFAFVWLILTSRWCHRVNYGASRWSRGSLWFVCFIWSHPGCRRVHSRIFVEFRRPGSRRIRLSSFSSLGCDPGVVWFIRARPGCSRVHSSSLWRPPVGSRVHSRSFGSFIRSAAVVGFICIRSKTSCGSSGIFAFIQARTVGCLVHSGSFGYFVRAPGVVGFIRARPGVVGFIRVRLLQWGALQWSSGLLGRSPRVVGFISVLSGAPRVSLGVHWHSFGSFGRARRLVGFVHVRLVHSHSFAIFGRTLVFVGFIRVYSGVPRWSSGSFGFV